MGGRAAPAAVLSSRAGWFKSKTTKIRELQEKLDSGLNNCIETLAKSMRGKCESELFPRIYAQYDAMLALQTGMLDMCKRFQAENRKLLDIAERNRKLMTKRIKEIGG